MGKIQFFAINFNTERQVFYPGEQLSGNVVLVLNEPMEARAIKMEFEGISFSSLTFLNSYFFQPDVFLKYVMFFIRRRFFPKITHEKFKRHFDKLFLTVYCI